MKYKYLIIEKTRMGYKIHTDDAPTVHYIDYTLKNALQAYRRAHGLKYKHFEKKYI